MKKNNRRYTMCRHTNVMHDTALIRYDVSLEAKLWTASVL